MTAQQSGNAQIEVDIGRDDTLEKAFQLTNAVNCPRDRYKFLLTPDSDFVSLPVDTIELSRSDSTRVSVVFDSNGLEPGIYTANVTVKCNNCGQCRARHQILRVAMTVIERGTSTEDGIIVPVPDVTGSRVTEATEQLNELGLQPVMERAGIARADLVTVLNQQPEPGVAVDVGTRVSLVPGVPVPDVVGLDRAKAKTRLDELGLLLVIANRDVSAEDLTTVAAQDPAANLVVPIGTPVNLVLSGAGRLPLPRGWLPAVVLLLILGTVILYWRRSPRTKAAAAANIDVRSQVDPGTQRVWPDISDRPRAVIRVRLLSDAGEQSVHGDPASMTGRE